MANNPMKNPIVVKKMLETKKKRIENGTLIFKRGPDHWLWKGNRGFTNSLRVYLYPLWTKKVLIRDNFKCSICGSKKISKYII